MKFDIDNFTVTDKRAQSQGRNLPARQGAPLIAALVDRSGSMSECLTAMETGLNGFIREQRELAGGAAITLAQFDTEFELVWPMQDIAGVPAYKLVPRGGTALLDAIGKFVTETGETIGDDEQWRKVIVVIVTDGAENQSREWTRDAIVDLIDYWRSTYQWEFVFLGANIDAVATAQSFGIPTTSALTFDTRRARASYAVLSKHVTEVREAGAAEFTEQDRRRALGQ